MVVKQVATELQHTFQTYGQTQCTMKSADKTARSEKITARIGQNQTYRRPLRRREARLGGLRLESVWGSTRTIALIAKNKTIRYPEWFPVLPRGEESLQMLSFFYLSKLP
ncbi:MAG: hypothetical protein FWH27_02145 [Planctomycetaceae bacterium]|nr:hypothetical protein [Planctomycetaceae bacterium]